MRTGSADRISAKFLTTVLENFRRDGPIREKYNVVTGSSEATVTAGYKTNMIGFGWTNGVFLQLLHELPPQWRETPAAGSRRPLNRDPTQTQRVWWFTRLIGAIAWHGTPAAQASPRPVTGMTNDGLHD